MIINLLIGIFSYILIGTVVYNVALRLDPPKIRQDEEAILAMSCTWPFSAFAFLAYNWINFCSYIVKQLSKVVKIVVDSIFDYIERLKR